MWWWGIGDGIGEGIGKGLGEESWRGKLGKGKVKENGKTKGGHDKYPGNVILSSIFRIDKKYTLSAQKVPTLSEIYDFYTLKSLHLDKGHQLANPLSILLDHFPWVISWEGESWPTLTNPSNWTFCTTSYHNNHLEGSWRFYLQKINPLHASIPYFFSLVAYPKGAIIFHRGRITCTCVCSNSLHSLTRWGQPVHNSEVGMSLKLSISVHCMKKTQYVVHWKLSNSSYCWMVKKSPQQQQDSSNTCWSVYKSLCTR